jgi:hypothetical protein
MLVLIKRRLVQGPVIVAGRYRFFFLLNFSLFPSHSVHYPPLIFAFSFEINHLIMLGREYFTINVALIRRQARDDRHECSHGQEKKFERERRD